jgi:hypothetical protein
METQNKPIQSTTQLAGGANIQHQDSQQNNPIQRKLNKILESRIENEKVFLPGLCFLFNLRILERSS